VKTATVQNVAVKVWTLPAARSKTKTAVIRPLSAMAMQVLDKLPEVPGCPFYFTLDGKRPITAFDRHKKAFDAQLLVELQKQGSGAALEAYRIHDLRRTSRSLMSRAGIDSDLAERMLGHRIGGVRRVYDKFDFVPPMTAAFEVLARLIHQIVEPGSGMWA
jgi:integrase